MKHNWYIYAAFIALIINLLVVILDYFTGRWNTLTYVNLAIVCWFAYRIYQGYIEYLKNKKRRQIDNGRS